jgi:predicted Rossmann-fold nucleotide-binding protein
MAITLPREERFKNQAPQRVDHNHLRTLKESGHRNSHVALQIQFLAHALLTNPDYYEVLRRWPRVQIQQIRGMAFESYYPLPDDIRDLRESLRGKSSPVIDNLRVRTSNVHNEVRGFARKMELLIEQEESYWESTRWNLEQLSMHQDVEAVDMLVKSLYGRLSFFGSARLDKGSPEYEGTRWLSQTLVEELANDDGTTEEVVTGGGPGIMEAGNQGALEGSWNFVQKLKGQVESGERDKEEVEFAIQLHRERLQSIGVRIELPFETGWNSHLQLNLSLPKFPARKEALINVVTGTFGPNREMPDYQNRHPAFFIMKGGIGTKDEGWEAICLMQCGKLPPRPIFIVGESERRVFEMTMKEMEMEGTISPGDATLRIGGKEHLIYCDNEVDAARKYVDWYGIQPPPSFERKLAERVPSIRNDENGNGSNHNSGGSENTLRRTA